MAFLDRAKLAAEIAKLGAEIYELICKARTGALAHGFLLKVLEEASVRVARWPAWKRGLPPCASEGCDMAAGHPPPCDRPARKRARRAS